MNYVLGMILMLFILVVLLSLLFGLDRHFPFLKLKSPEKESLSSRAYAKAQLLDEFRWMFIGIYFLGTFYFSSWIPYIFDLYTADPFPLIKILFYIYIACFAAKLLFYGACLLKTYIIKSDSGA